MSVYEKKMELQKQVEALSEDEIALKVADILLNREAVKLQVKDPFTWASGLKSPIYCDNRKILGYPDDRTFVALALAKKVKDYYPEATLIAGTATAGIPYATLIADILDLPLAYVRPEPKDHGRKKQIDGDISADDKVVVVDDLISTGGSVLKAAKAVNEVATVCGVLANFTYQMQKSYDNFEEAVLEYKTLSNFTKLLEQADKIEYISKEDRAYIEKWREENFG